MIFAQVSKPGMFVAIVGMSISCCLPITPTIAGEPQSQSQISPETLTVRPLGLFRGLTIDPSREDPAITFETWRRANKITITAPSTVQLGHMQFVAQHQAPNGINHPSSLSPLAPTVGNNVDLAGGLSFYQGEVAIAQNPFGSEQLVVGANTFNGDPACKASAGTTLGTQALFGSVDGGQTWNYSCAPWPSSVAGSAGFAQFGSDPSIAWDTNGNAYAGYLLVNEANGDSLVVAKSIDHGQTWQSYGVVANETLSPTVFEDKDMIAVDSTNGGAYSHTNRLYIIWDEIVLNSAGTTKISQLQHVAYSDDGSSWHTTDIDTSTAYADIGGDLAIGSDGTVYAVWNRISPLQGSETSESTVFSKSVDGGQTWSAPIAVASHNLLSFGNNSIDAQNSRGINSFPSIAVDTSTSAFKGSLYVAYTDYPSGTNSGDNTNVYCAVSANGGASWPTPVRVNDDSGLASQFFPWVAVDKSSGQAVMSWYDTRNDSANKQTQIFLSTSVDGGSTWAANTLVTEPGSQFNNSTVNYSDENTADNTQANINQYGDYAQISVAYGMAHPVWMDSRQFYPSFHSSSLREDVVSTSVSVGSTFNPAVLIPAAFVVLSP